MRGGPAPQRQREGTNATELGRKKLSIVNAKLQGRTTVDALPMSVEGQVHWLIEQATDANNLCRMYQGWAPWL